MTDNYPAVQCFCGRSVGFLWKLRYGLEGAELKKLLDDLKITQACCRVAVILPVKKHKFYPKQRAGAEVETSTYADHISGEVYKGYISSKYYDMNHTVTLV